MRRDVFQAIADPIRREIIELLSNESLTINEVAQNFDISRPAVSKHLKRLEECDVIEIKKKGRERYCTLVSQSLDPALEWLKNYQNGREDSLDSFANHLKKLRIKNRGN